VVEVGQGVSDAAADAPVANRLLLPQPLHRVDRHAEFFGGIGLRQQSRKVQQVTH